MKIIEFCNFRENLENVENHGRSSNGKKRLKFAEKSGKSWNIVKLKVQKGGNPASLCNYDA